MKLKGGNMNDDFFLLDIPDYIPTFENKKAYGYNNSKLKNELLRLLCEVSDGYCMYCYNSIKINGNFYADLEHGIEKSINADQLEECVPNISISCPKCNQKYKKVGEKKRVSFMKCQKFYVDHCKKNNCKKLCDSMIEFRKKYITNGNLLIRPFENYSLENHKLELQYDVLNAKYIPSRKNEYSETEKRIIEGHIELFQLNTSIRRNREVSLYCKDVIDYKNLLIGMRYNNFIVKLLQEKLQNLNNLNNAIEICKIIYFFNFIKMAT